MDWLFRCSLHTGFKGFRKINLYFNPEQLEVSQQNKIYENNVERDDLGDSKSLKLPLTSFNLNSNELAKRTENLRITCEIKWRNDFG